MMGNIIVGGLLILAIALVTYKLVKDKKTGRKGCGCGCSDCGGCNGCNFKDLK